MNTKEAYAKYGRWAVVSGYAAYRRQEEGWDETLKQSVDKSLHDHEKWESGGLVGEFDADADYDDAIPPFFVFRARLRT